MSLEGELKELVKQWLAYDDEIKSLRKAVSDRSKLQKKIGNQILEFMDEHDIQDLKTSKGNLKYHVSEKKKNPTPEDIRVKLMEKLGNPKMVQEVYDSIYNTNHDTIEKVSLKRTEDSKADKQQLDPELNSNNQKNKNINKNKNKLPKKINYNYNQNHSRPSTEIRDLDEDFVW